MEIQIRKFNLENVGLSTDFNYSNGRFIITEQLSEFLKGVLVENYNAGKDIIDKEKKSNIIVTFYNVLWKKCCDSFFFQQLLQRGLWPETNLIKEALNYDNVHAFEAAILKFVGRWDKPNKTKFYLDIIQYSLSISNGTNISRFIKTKFDETLIFAAIGYHIKRELDSHQIGKHVFTNITKSKILTKLSYKFFAYYNGLCEAITKYNEISIEMENASTTTSTSSTDDAATISNFKRNLNRLKRLENLILEIEIIMPLIKETILFEHSKLMSIYTSYEKSFKLEKLISNKFDVTLIESIQIILVLINGKKFQKHKINVGAILPNFNTLCFLYPDLFNYFVESKYFNLKSFGKWNRSEIPKINNIDKIKTPLLKKSYIDGSFLNLEMFKLTKSFLSCDPCSTKTLQDDFLIHDRPDEEFLYFEENELGRFLIEDTFYIETDENLYDCTPQFNLSLKDIASKTNQYVEDDNHTYFQLIRTLSQQIYNK
ncbi:hypothetical protein ACTA71_009298 [Dictyostelium dimigraforme]